MKTKEHYEALTRIAQSNFEEYIEMIDEYETADDCFDSFWGNTGDTVRENVKGWDQEDVDYAVGTYINLVVEYREQLADELKTAKKVYEYHRDVMRKLFLEHQTPAFHKALQTAEQDLRELNARLDN